MGISAGGSGVWEIKSFRADKREGAVSTSVPELVLTGGTVGKELLFVSRLLF